MQKVHWPKTETVSMCGLVQGNQLTGTILLAKNAGEVSCARCQKAIPAVMRTAWDYLLDDEDVPPVVSTPPPRKKRPRSRKKKAIVAQDELGLALLSEGKDVNDTAETAGPTDPSPVIATPEPSADLRGYYQSEEKELKKYAHQVLLVVEIVIILGVLIWLMK